MTDGIKVICQTTEEQREETKQLFEQCKPYLDKGKSLNYAVRQVKPMSHSTFTGQRWFKDLREYAMAQGYPGRY